MGLASRLEPSPRRRLDQMREHIVSAGHCSVTSATQSKPSHSSRISSASDESSVMNSNYPREDAVGGLAARRRRDTLECRRKGACDIRLSIGARRLVKILRKDCQFKLRVTPPLDHLRRFQPGRNQWEVGVSEWPETVARHLPAISKGSVTRTRQLMGERFRAGLTRCRKSLSTTRAADGTGAHNNGGPGVTSRVVVPRDH